MHNEDLRKAAKAERNKASKLRRKAKGAESAAESVPKALVTASSEDHNKNLGKTITKPVTDAVTDPITNPVTKPVTKPAVMSPTNQGGEPSKPIIKPIVLTITKQDVKLSKKPTPKSEPAEEIDWAHNYLPEHEKGAGIVDDNDFARNLKALYATPTKDKKRRNRKIVTDQSTPIQISSWNHVLAATPFERSESAAPVCEKIEPVQEEQFTQMCGWDSVSAATPFEEVSYLQWAMKNLRESTTNKYVPSSRRMPQLS